MTKETMKLYGEMMLAVSDGKIVEYDNGYGLWFIVKDCEGAPNAHLSIAECLSPRCHPTEPLKLRIKPEKKKRLIRAEELGQWFRCEDYDAQSCWRAISEVGSDYFRIGTILYDLNAPLPEWQHSVDRKEIRSFFVEER